MLCRNNDGIFYRAKSAESMKQYTSAKRLIKRRSRNVRKALKRLWL